jgi:hypothetical protein
MYDLQDDVCDRPCDEVQCRAVLKLTSASFLVSDVLVSAVDFPGSEGTEIMMTDASLES